MPALPHAWKIPSSEDTERSQKGVGRTEGVAAEAQLDAVRGKVGLQHPNTPSPTGRAPPGFGSATPPGARPRPRSAEARPRGKKAPRAQLDGKQGPSRYGEMFKRGCKGGRSPQDERRRAGSRVHLPPVPAHRGERGGGRGRSRHPPAPRAAGGTPKRPRGPPLPPWSRGTRGGGLARITYSLSVLRGMFLGTPRSASP